MTTRSEFLSTSVIHAASPIAALVGRRRLAARLQIPRLERCFIGAPLADEDLRPVHGELPISSVFLNSGAQLPEPIEDQLLDLDEHGFGDHTTGATGTGRSGDRCQQMRE
jgi:hypothetical protein